MTKAEEIRIAKIEVRNIGNALRNQGELTEKEIVKIEIQLYVRRINMIHWQRLNKLGRLGIIHAN